MPHSLSLSRKKDFDFLFKFGKRFHSQHFTITYMSGDSFLISFITPKKHIAKATARNYTRRVVREETRKILTLDCLPPYHIAIVCKTDLSKYRKNKEQLAMLINDFNSLFNKIPLDSIKAS